MSTINSARGGSYRVALRRIDYYCIGANLIQELHAKLILLARAHGRSDAQLLVLALRGEGVLATGS